jgi:glucokinase
VSGVVVGVDLGGTTVRVGVARVDAPGDLLASVDAPTTRHGASALVDQVVASAMDVVDRCGHHWNDVRAMTVGAPGVIRPDGHVEVASNVVGLSGTPLRALLAEGVGAHVELVVENDANIAAIGEGSFGAAVAYGSYAVLTIGTGIGCGIVVDGRLMRGAHGAAGELGLLPHDGSPIERLASGPALEAEADGASATAVLERAADGDARAIELVSQQAALVAEAVTVLSLVLDPEVVVLTGGVGGHPAMLQPVRQALARSAPLPVRVVTSALGDRAGLLGALADAAARMASP